MSRDLLVSIDQGGSPVACGRLWTRGVPREGATFEYDATWLARRGAFALDPELPLGPGQFHTARPLFRAFTDPAPDRWGQTLLRRAERARAHSERRTARTLTAVDFLTLVEDETRVGALRFRDADAAPEAPFLSTTSRPVPPLLALSRLMGAAARVSSDDADADDLALLLAPGTSLGGARPKASVRDPDGRLLIAKFPRKDDEWPVVRWEATLLALAARSGIAVPDFRLALVSRKPVLLLARFDRRAGRRVPFMSAMTALGADDNEPRSYLDIVDALRRTGARAKADIAELWRRMVFSILVSNTDDHLRNHALVHEGAGWCLAPAYDLNPMPTDIRPRVHALALDESDATSSMDTAFAVAPRFGLSLAEARAMARPMARVVGRWRQAATQQGLSRREIDRMESAFDEEARSAAAR